MNFCPFCGKELTESMQFCPFCGNLLKAKQHSKASAPHTVQAHTTQQTATLPKSTKTSKKNTLIPLLILVLIALAAVFSFKPVDNNFSENPEAIEKAANSVVKLSCYDCNNILFCTGSGFAALDEGIIITNHHVIDESVYSIELETESGDLYSVDSIVAYDKERDIAILRVPDCSLPPLKTNKGHNLKKGHKVVSIGSPIGIANTVATGNFSNYLNKGSYVQILSTASTSPGSSGGALFNNRGAVIGITSGVYPSGYDLYYSIPMLYVEELYRNSDPKKEMTIVEFYEQSEHPYSVDYITANGNILHNQPVVVYGYISGMDASIFLVSSPDLVLHVDLRNQFDLEAAILLSKLKSEKQALEVDTLKIQSETNSLTTGDMVSVSGTLLYDSYGMKLIASEIQKTTS